MHFVITNKLEPHSVTFQSLSRCSIFCPTTMLVLSNARKLSDKTLCDYTDGSAFKEHPLFSEDPMAIRWHMYVDDFEVCNPIGSRRTIHKLTAMYFVVGNVRPKYWSQSSTIHLALLAELTNGFRDDW